MKADNFEFVWNFTSPVAILVVLPEIAASLPIDVCADLVVKKWRDAKRRIDDWGDSGDHDLFQDAVITMQSCAYCVKFFGEESVRCEGCPVMLRTGKTYCQGTPVQAIGEEP